MIFSGQSSSDDLIPGWRLCESSGSLLFLGTQSVLGKSWLTFLYIYLWDIKSLGQLLKQLIIICKHPQGKSSSEMLNFSLQVPILFWFCPAIIRSLFSSLMYLIKYFSIYWSDFLLSYMERLLPVFYPQFSVEQIHFRNFALVPSCWNALYLEYHTVNSLTPSSLWSLLQMSPSQHWSSNLKL